MAYIEFFRGTPLLIQLTMIYFGLPELGLKLDPFVAGVLALGLNYAAAEAENYRAGLESVPAGQLEAAAVLGLSRWQTLRHVVGPQAVRISIPPMTNDFIALLEGQLAGLAGDAHRADQDVHQPRQLDARPPRARADGGARATCCSGCRSRSWRGRPRRTSAGT